MIQIKEDSEIIPFDVTGMRTINVDYRFIDNINSCKENIIKQIKSIEESGNHSNFLYNPKQHAACYEDHQMSRHIGHLFRFVGFDNLRDK